MNQMGLQRTDIEEVGMALGVIAGAFVSWVRIVNGP
tara:strand:- start:271 stop:378 length:108 start_codon:yes stop_codon:yes gene_type:complete